MATNIRGRGGWGARGDYHTTGTTTVRNRPDYMGKTHTVGKQTMWPKTKTMTVPPKYKGIYDTFTWKINSFKTLYNQTRGPAKYTRPTPATLNTFASWINKGNIIQICTPNQVAKWARTTKMNFNTRTGSPTTCKNVLYKKFGKSAIKAVARTKTGSYMVVTPPTWKGKPFYFPK